MEVSQNEVRLLCEALYYCIAAVADAPRNPRAMSGGKEALREIKSCGLTMERLRDDSPLTDEDISNLIDAFTLLAEECLLTPEEIAMAYVLSEKIELLRSRFELLEMEWQ